MAVSYNNMWKLMIDKKVSASTLRKAADISPNTMTKFHKDDLVSLDVLCRICGVLECDICDLVTYIPDEKPAYGVRRR